MRKQHVSVVFIHSKIIFTESKESVFKRGLNFCILPLNLDITQILVEFNRFERTMRWQEFWHGKLKEGEVNPPIFKLRKTNLPKIIHHQMD